MKTISQMCALVRRGLIARINEAVQSAGPARAVITTFVFTAIWGAVALMWTPTSPEPAGDEYGTGIGVSRELPAVPLVGLIGPRSDSEPAPSQTQAGPSLLPQTRQTLNVPPVAPDANQLPSPPQRRAEMGDPAVATIGGVDGGVVVGGAGLMAVDQWPRFREYVIQQHHVSNRYNQPVAVGDELPGPAEYYDIPPEFGEHGYYRYAIVNDRTVIVDPLRRVVVQVVD